MRNQSLYALLREMAEAIAQSGMEASDIAEASGGRLTRWTPYRYTLMWKIIMDPSIQSSVKFSVPERKTIIDFIDALRLDEETRMRWLRLRAQAKADERRAKASPDAGRETNAELSIVVGDGSPVTEPLFTEACEEEGETEKDLAIRHQYCSPQEM